jgi:hypothetical protein
VDGCLEQAFVKDELGKRLCLAHRDERVGELTYNSVAVLPCRWRGVGGERCEMGGFGGGGKAGYVSADGTVLLCEAHREAGGRSLWCSCCMGREPQVVGFWNGEDIGTLSCFHCARDDYVRWSSGRSKAASKGGSEVGEGEGSEVGGEIGRAHV